jgi:hypothetical protein
MMLHDEGMIHTPASNPFVEFARVK